MKLDVIPNTADCNFSQKSTQCQAFNTEGELGPSLTFTLLTVWVIILYMIIIAMLEFNDDICLNI